MPESKSKPKCAGVNQMGDVVKKCNSFGKRKAVKSNERTSTKSTDSRDSYQSLASNALNSSDNDVLEALFVSAAKDGNCDQIQQIIQRRNEIIFSIDERDSETGNTALIWAAKRGHTKIVELLLHHGADVTLRNFDGQTAVEVASPQIRTCLLESADRGGPHRNLLQAAWQSNAKLTHKILNENHVDINVRNGDGLTPLLLVVRDLQLFEKLGDKVLKSYDPKTVVSQLINHRGDTNAVDGEGKTALHHVATSKAAVTSSIVDIFITEGVSTELRDKRLFTPLHCACQNGNFKTASALLDGGADVNAKGFAGASPLHIAALNGSDEVCSLLLQNDADITMVDDTGLTALDVAKTKRVKTTLKNAWVIATQNKVANYLGPVRTSLELKRTNSASIPLSHMKRSGSFSQRESLDYGWDGLASSHSLESLTPRRSSTVVSNLPSRPSLGGSLDKSRITEELLNEATNTARATPTAPFASSVRGSYNRLTPSCSPRSPTQVRKLTPLRTSVKPNFNQKKEIKFSPGTKQHDGRQHKKSSADPLHFSGPLPVTMLGDEFTDGQQPRGKKLAGGAIRRGHTRCHSDPWGGGTATPSGICLDSVEEFTLQGRSPSKISQHSEEFGESPVPETTKEKLTPLPRTPSFKGTHGLKIPDTIEESAVSAGKRSTRLDLAQMQLTNRSTPLQVDHIFYPNSKQTLPPTPISVVPEYSTSHDCLEDEDDTNNTSEQLTCKSVIKTGEFNIEDTRVRDSNDSGLPEDTKIGSKNSSLASSDSNFSSCGESSGESHAKRQDSVKEHKTANQEKSSFKQHTSTSENFSAKTNSGISEKLREVAKDNATHFQKSSHSSSVNSSSVKQDTAAQSGNVDKITVFKPIDKELEDTTNFDKQYSGNKPNDPQVSDIMAHSNRNEIKNSLSLVTAGIGSSVNSKSNPTSGTPVPHKGNMGSKVSSISKEHSMSVKPSTKVILVQAALAAQNSSKNTRTNSNANSNAGRIGSNTNSRKNVSNNSSKVGSNINSGTRVGSNTNISRVGSRTVISHQTRSNSNTNASLQKDTAESQTANQSTSQEAPGNKNNSQSKNESKVASEVQNQPSPSSSSYSLPGKPVVTTSIKQDISVQNTTSTTTNTSKSEHVDKKKFVEKQNNVMEDNDCSSFHAPPVLAEGNHPDGVDINSIVKVNFTQHEGPVIYDPFESLRREREKQEAEVAAASKAPKSGRTRPLCSQPMKKPPVKDSHTRQVSAGKRRKANKKSDEKSKSRPPSGNKKKGRRKKKELKEDVLEGKDITYISGVGWHIKAGSGDNQDVKEVIMTADSSDSENEERNLRLNYTKLAESKVKLNRHRENDALPEKMFKQNHSDESEEEYESDFEDIPVEIVYDQVENVFDEPPEPDTDKGKRKNSTPRVYSALVGIDEPEVTPQTAKAITEFENTLKASDLETMLGSTRRRRYRPSSKSPDLLSKVTSTPVLPFNNEVNTYRDENTSRAYRKSSKSPPPSTRSGNASLGHVPHTAPNSTPQRPPRTRKMKRDSDSASSTDSQIISSSNSHKPLGISKSLDPKVLDNENKTPVKPPRRKRSKGTPPIPGQITENDEDTNISKIIDEILKTTPDHTLTQKSRNLQNKDSTSMSKEELDNALQRSNVFKEVKTTVDDDSISLEAANLGIDVNENQLSAVLTGLGGAEGDRLRAVLARMNPHDLKQIHDLQKQVAEMKEKEKFQMDRLVNNIANLELKVVNPNDAVFNKPPIDPKSNLSRVLPGNLGDKSPRFIQKHDSLRNPLAKGNLQNENEDLEIPVQSDDEDDEDNTLNANSASMSIPYHSTFISNREDLSANRAEMVTSCIGRRSMASGSRSNSAMTSTSTSSVPDGDIETIQWKRGNMLGKGAYGKVWCGLTNAGELIAVKQIELNIDDMERAEQEYEKIQEEVDLLKTLKHKNIVGYLGTSLEDDVVSIFMQFVPGGSLASILARFGALEEEVFCHYTRQILEGVQYLHKNDVIHRDIKGGNIMLMPNGVIKLIDFGCAKKLCVNMSLKGSSSRSSKNRLLKSMRGTPYWMAPEVVKETGHGTISDIWSIGCTVFEMATKRPPWADMPPMSAIFCIGDGTKPVPQLPDKFSEDAIDFTNQCLTRDPNLRPSATLLLQHAFVSKKKKKSGSLG